MTDKLSNSIVEVATNLKFIDRYRIKKLDYML